jgi:hypothetical protein
MKIMKKLFEYSVTQFSHSFILPESKKKGHRQKRKQKYYFTSNYIYVIDHRESLGCMITERLCENKY